MKPTINGKEVKLFIGGVEIKGVKLGEGGGSCLQDMGEVNDPWLEDSLQELRELKGELQLEFKAVDDCIYKGGGGDAALFDKDGNPTT